MEQTLLEAFIEHGGPMGILAGALLVFLVIVYRNKEKEADFYRERDREDIGVMKDLTNVINTMNTNLDKSPGDIRDKISADIQKQLASIENKLDLILHQHGKK